MGRRIVWFSCGAASAVTAKFAVEQYGNQVKVVYCFTLKDENPDNHRFFYDVQDWIGRDISVIRSQKFSSIEEVFEQTRYMAGRNGARCTVEMKKVPRFEFQLPEDIHLFGYTTEETTRIKRFEGNNPDLFLEWILRDHGLTKEDCFKIIRDAEIELPVMYGLGYKNNNCLGCVKATSTKYWNMIRRDFPEVFERRAVQSRDIGCRLTRIKGRRIFLDELPAESDDGVLENITCGPECA